MSVSIKKRDNLSLKYNRQRQVPIWFVFKNGRRINLNDSSLLIEDITGRFARLRKLGKAKIAKWQQLNKRLGYTTLPP